MTRAWESDRNLVTSVGTAWGSVSKVLHRYQYDALNRRTAEYKRGEMFDIYGGASAVGIGRKYEYDDNAGGVGGLLMIKDGSKVYFPGYDGNGNVSAFIDSDSTDGTLDAKYEYGAFGEPLRVGGTTIAADNPFRFSTKYTDTDGARERVDGDAEGVARRAEEAGAPWALMRQTGLVYYGFRYYSPSLGRFLNRDPLGEDGGENLYAIGQNDLVNNNDLLGLETVDRPYDPKDEYVVWETSPVTEEDNVAKEDGYLMPVSILWRFLIPHPVTRTVLIGNCRQARRISKTYFSISTS